jgi:hypothetical protein
MADAPRPLIVPLKRQWFEAFARGEKTEEWRRHGARWNARHCWPGRPVILTLGYASAICPEHADRRLHATLAAVEYRQPDTEERRDLLGDVECVVLKLTDIRTER